MQSKYELLPTSDSLASRSSSSAPYSLDGEDVECDAALNPRTRETREAIRAFKADPRFNRTPPSPWARGALVLFCILLVYGAFEARKAIWVDFGMGMGEEVEVVDGVY